MTAILLKSWIKLSPFLKWKEYDSYIFVKISRFSLLLMEIANSNVLGDPLSDDSWNENIVMNNEFVGSCSIIKNEYLVQSCVGCHVRAIRELYLWDNVFWFLSLHFTMLYPIDCVRKWLSGEIDTMCWDFVIGAIFTGALEKLNPYWANFSRILSFALLFVHSKYIHRQRRMLNNRLNVLLDALWVGSKMYIEGTLHLKWAA